MGTVLLTRTVALEPLEAVEAVVLAALNVPLMHPPEHQHTFLHLTALVAVHTDAHALIDSP